MKSISAIDLSEFSFETKRDVNFYIKEKFQNSSKFTKNQISKIKNVAKNLEDGSPRDYLIGNSEFSQMLSVPGSFIVNRYQS